MSAHSQFSSHNVVLPLVTVVIPCYNQAHFLRESLMSLLEQTDQRWEAIVVDDASPDAAAIDDAVAAAADPRILLVHHDKNRGLAAARNTGVRKGRTEYYLCLDADDKLHPRLIERTLSEALLNTALDCVIPDYVNFGASDKRHICQVPSAASILLDQPLHPCGVLIRKDTWARVGGYDESPVLRNGREDWEFYIRLFHADCKAVHCPEPLYLYRTYPGSMNLRCRRVEHIVRRYIYRKHRDLFDRESRRKILGTGFDRAACAALEDKRRLAALFYASRALGFGISTKRLRRCVASLPSSLQCLGLRRLMRHLMRDLTHNERSSPL